MVNNKKFYEDGLRFECQDCGGCCKTHNEYAYVYLSGSDVDEICKYLGQERIDFLNQHCLNDSNGYVHLSKTTGDCDFLDKDGRCKIYAVRPKQCETWPFWTESLNEKDWNGYVKKSCPGIGKGKLYSKKQIEKIARDRDQWYDE